MSLSQGMRQAPAFEIHHLSHSDDLQLWSESKKRSDDPRFISPAWYDISRDRQVHVSLPKARDYPQLFA